MRDDFGSVCFFFSFLLARRTLERVWGKKEEKYSYDTSIHTVGAMYVLDKREMSRCPASMVFTSVD